ncbi:MAG: hypothetical protein HUU60_07775 [Armatimonadetes bacterium]|nr:hypothetical protein [Armatimonadota bacterium]
MASSPERLAYWYLRLNGFLTIENFVVHPDTGANQRTDVDLLAVRFRHRAENLMEHMVDDLECCLCDAYANVVIAEVKRGVCALNGPWTRKDDGNIHRVLAAIGCLDQDKIAAAADALYEEGAYRGEIVQLRLMAFGNQEGKLPIPATQILFDHMIQFIWERFKAYDRQKRAIGNWADDGQALRRIFDENRRTQARFANAVRQCFGLPEAVEQ